MVAKCPVCGHRFETTAAVSCKGCPLNSDCDKICCPNCHYGWLESTSVVKSLLSLVRRNKKFGRS